MHRKDKVIAKNIDPMLTIKEVSRLLHVHHNTIRRWSNMGIIQTYRIGSRADRRFRQNDIAWFLAYLRVSGDNLQKANMF
ncbi:helix-turn-helix domain-containing protein [Chloroflexota bacterium]